MTLFTSDIKSKKDLVKNQYAVYSAVTMFVLLFGSIYEYFGHGIFSFYMQFAFLFPLVLGLVMPLLLYLLYTKKAPNHRPGAVYHYGVAVLTVGSIVKGVLEIYGTDSDLLIPYFVVGPFLLLYGIFRPLTKKQ